MIALQCRPGLVWNLHYNIARGKENSALHCCLTLERDARGVLQGCALTATTLHSTDRTKHGMDVIRNTAEQLDTLKNGSVLEMHKNY